MKGKGGQARPGQTDPHARRCHRVEHHPLFSDAVLPIQFFEGR